MSKERSQVGWSPGLYAVLLCASLVLYLLQVALFRRSSETIFYLLQDFAFLPVQVLLVTFVLNALIAMDPGREQLQSGFASLKTWSVVELNNLRALIAGSGQEIRPARSELERLRSLLGAERAFLLGLVENPNLLEHESFTEMLLAAFHLTEELACRHDFAELPASDLSHPAGDVQRVYRFIIQEWLSYAVHLRANYPYIFSLLARTHPLQAKPSAVVT